MSRSLTRSHPRWLLVSQQHHPCQGGIGTYVQRFVVSALKAGWRIDLVTRPSDLLPPASTVHTVVTTDRLPAFASRVPDLRRIERIRPYRYGLWSKAVAEKLLDLAPAYDAVEFVDSQAESFVALHSAAVRAHFRGVPMIVHAHTPMFVEETINGADESRFGRSIYHDWERRAIVATDGVITTSRLLADEFPPVHKLAIIPYPCPESNDATDASNDQETIVLVGSVQPRKGVETWARSLNIVLARRPRCRALLIGPDTMTGPAGGSMAAHVQSLIESELADRYRWLGQLPHDQVLGCIRRASCVVVPSLLESFSFAAAESLMAGTPVIISDRVGLAEHVSGLPSFPARDVEAMAQAQIKLLAEPDAARFLASHCREELLRSCAPQQCLQARLSFIERVSTGCDIGLDSTTHGALDAIDRMDALLRSIKQMERSSDVSYTHQTLAHEGCIALAR